MKTANLEINVAIDTLINGVYYMAENRFQYETGDCFDTFLEESKEELVYQLLSLNEEEDNFEELEKLIQDADFEVSFEVSEWEDVPENLQDLDILAEIAECVDDWLDWEIISAAYDLGIPFTAEAYVGEYSSDEEFAESLAEEMGLIDNNVSWPFTCIDWEFAAKELMYDYAESNGYYFRNL